MMVISRQAGGYGAEFTGATPGGAGSSFKLMLINRISPKKLHGRNSSDNNRRPRGWHRYV